MKQSRSMQLFADRVYRKSYSEASRRNYTVFIRLFMKSLGVNDADELTRRIKSGEINVVKSVNSWLSAREVNFCQNIISRFYLNGAGDIALEDILQKSRF